MTGPEPQSDHDYLIKIYERQGHQWKDITTLCEVSHDHEKRITALEKADACQESYQNGKTSIWITYKDFVQIVVSVVLTAIATIILVRWLGIT
ncbi:hypothetical protein M0R72_20185 [Candidatus Pacearchaeota archaeon]|jgi:hypothetical protein|nr:hypothetical protein [Candidatus Pacearchaeota archaeon]